MYQGKEGQWAFYLHRASGIALLAYLCLHTVNIGSVLLGETAYNTLKSLHQSPIFGVGLLLVTAGTFYHAFNGLRIVIMDFTGFGVRIQRQLWYGVLMLSLLGTVYAAIQVVPRWFDAK